MEILYGIVLLIIFILGISIGFFLTVLIKNYIAKEIEKGQKEEVIEKNEEKPNSLTREIIDEWQNGGIDYEQ